MDPPKKQKRADGIANNNSILPLYSADAFTSERFSGNPAAVCLVNNVEGLPEEKLQKLAAEMNLAETAFITRINEEDDFKNSSKFSLRWFSPTTEIPLCGHATLASAAVLFYCLDNSSSQITFQTLSGDVMAKRNGDKIILDFPLNPPEKEEGNDTEELVKLTAGSLPVEDVQYSPGTKKLMIRLADHVTRSQFESLNPPINKMQEVHNTGRVKGVIVTLKGSSDNGCVDKYDEVYDFMSRYFAPWDGIAEDPVCGSAHTVMGSYWSKVLGRVGMYARQCSKRGGDLWVTVRDDGRVDIAGNARIVIQGSVNIE